MKIKEEIWEDLSHFDIKFDNDSWLLQNKLILQSNYIDMELNFNIQKERVYSISIPYFSRYAITKQTDYYILLLNSKNSSRIYQILLKYPVKDIYSIIQISNRMIVLFIDGNFEVHVLYKQLIYEESLNHQGIMKDVFENMLKKKENNVPQFTDEETVDVLFNTGVKKITKRVLSYLFSNYVNDIIENLSPGEMIIDFSEISHIEFNLLYSPIWRNSDEKSLNILHKLNSIYFYVRCKELYNRMFPFVSTLNFSKLLKFFL